MKTSILQNKIEKCELDVVDITKHFETVDRTVSKNENNTNERMSMLQNKIKEIDNLSFYAYFSTLPPPLFCLFI